MRRGTPNFSIAVIACGNAASDDAVVNAISHGSRTDFQNFAIGMRMMIATGTSTTSTNTINDTYNVPTSLARLSITPSPLLPTVTPIAAPIPIGAYAITMPTNLNITSLSDCSQSSMIFLDGPSTRASATAKMIAKKTICSTSLLAAASKKLCGTVCSSTDAKVGVLAANALNSSLPPADVSCTPTPGFTQFTAIRPIASAAVVTISK